MERDPDDKRVLFQQVVDDILDQIRDGRLNPNDSLPSARKMADVYNVGSMTAQRALRELQSLRITYSIAGKGTFVHPDAFDILRGAVLTEPIEGDPQLRQQIADYLAQQRELLARFHQAKTTKDTNAAIADLIKHADEHTDLIDAATRYQTAHGNYAQQPEWLQRDDEPAAPPKRASRKKATEA